jgi:hypothetical protein
LCFEGKERKKKRRGKEKAQRGLVGRRGVVSERGGARVM